MARSSCFFTYICFLIFFFLLMLGVEKHAVEGEMTNQLVVGEVGSASSHKEMQGSRVECKNNKMHCKQGNGGVEQSSIFETGDYIYTNSNP